MFRVFNIVLLLFALFFTAQVNANPPIELINNAYSGSLLSKQLLSSWFRENGQPAEAEKWQALVEQQEQLEKDQAQHLDALLAGANNGEVAAMLALQRWHDCYAGIQPESVKSAKWQREAVQAKLRTSEDMLAITGSKYHGYFLSHESLRRQHHEFNILAFQHLRELQADMAKKAVPEPALFDAQEYFLLTEEQEDTVSFHFWSGENIKTHKNDPTYIQAEYNPQQRNLHIYLQRVSKICQRQGIGTKLLQIVVDLIGKPNVKTISAYLVFTNREAFENALANGLTPEMAAQKTPIWRSLTRIFGYELPVQISSGTGEFDQLFIFHSSQTDQAAVLP